MNGSKRKCKVCKEEKDLISFQKCMSKVSKKIYRIHTCNKCRRKKEMERHPEIIVKDLERLRKWKDEKRGTMEGFIYSNLYRWRDRSTEECNLTSDYLMELWKKQEGKCYYSGIKLDCIIPAYGKNKISKSLCKINSPSLDRIYSDKGYIVGNVVWCSNVINTMKSNLDPNYFIELCGIISKKGKV